MLFRSPNVIITPIGIQKSTVELENLQSIVNEVFCETMMVRDPVIGYISETEVALSSFYDDSSDLQSGIVVHIGTQTTTVIPFVNNDIFSDAMVEIQIGGDHITKFLEYMIKILQFMIFFNMDTL